MWTLEHRRATFRHARRRFPFFETIFADAGYQGPKMAKIVSWSCPKRWIVERTLAWISRNRRLARDFEPYVTTFAAFFRLAMIRIMLKRLTRLNLCL